jgi:hypothetical protein
VAHHKSRRKFSDLNLAETSRLKEQWLHGDLSASALVDQFHLSHTALAYMRLHWGERPNNKFYSRPKKG